MKYKTILGEAANEERRIVEENIKAFYEFIYQRQLVWHNRFVLKLPREKWTKDPYLKNSKYTNIYRELDRGTLWWFDHIATIWNKKSLNQNERKKEIIWQTCVYRLLNKVETFDIVGVPSFKSFQKDIVQKKWYAHIQKLLDDGVKVWSSATITLQSNLKATRLQNLQTILGKLVKDLDLLAENIITTDGIEEVFKYVLKRYGFGPFTAYEVTTDLAYLSCFNLDINEWANAGPGCIPGIKLIFPWAINRADYPLLMKLLRDNQEKAFKRYKIPFDKVALRGEYLNLRDIEHSLCEWRKYYSQERKIGRPRIKFIEETLPNDTYDKRWST